MAPVLGALFAILIGILAIHPYLVYQQQSFENIKAANTASQFRQLINAVEVYVQNNCLPTTSNGSIPTSCANMSVSTLLPQLQAAGYLPQGIIATNPYGQNWYVNVSQSADGDVQALLYSAGGQLIPTKTAPEIAAETGKEGGFVPQKGEYGSTVGSNTAQGAYGYWNVPIPQNISPMPVPGDLVALLDVGQSGTDDSQNSDYLYRRQVPGDTQHQLNTMQTDLNMGGNNIENALTVQVSAKPTTPILAEMETSGTADSLDVNAQGGVVQTSSPDQKSYVNMQSDDAQSSLNVNGSTAATLDMTGSQSASVNMTSEQASTLGMTGNQSASVNMTSGGSTALTMTGNGSSSVNITSDGTSSLTLDGKKGTTLTVGTAGATSGLVFSALEETVGTTTNCSQGQLGTVAPNENGSGMPVACVNINGTYEWKAMGSGFTAPPTTVTYQPNTLYQNTSTEPEFISSDCTWSFAGPEWPFGQQQVVDYSLFLYVLDSKNDVLATAHDAVGNDDYSTGASPSASIMVPPGDFFEYNTAVPPNSSAVAAVPSSQTCNFSIVQ